MQEPYDISLSAGCQAPPALDDLKALAPALNEPALYSKLLEQRPGGFLGLDLPQDLAKMLLRRLQVVKARGQIVPSAYREPKISIEVALPIAMQSVAELRGAHFPTYSFEPVHYWREGPRWWIFLAGSKQLQHEGRIPGALFAYVDKLDGYVWGPEEMEQLFNDANNL